MLRIKAPGPLEYQQNSQNYRDNYTDCIRQHLIPQFWTAYFFVPVFCLQIYLELAQSPIRQKDQWTLFGYSLSNVEQNSRKSSYLGYFTPRMTEMRRYTLAAPRGLSNAISGVHYSQPF
jgi:hypothetical protein